MTTFNSYVSLPEGKFPMWGCLKMDCTPINLDFYGGNERFINLIHSNGLIIFYFQTISCLLFFGSIGVSSIFQTHFSFESTLPNEFKPEIHRVKPHQSGRGFVWSLASEPSESSLRQMGLFQE